MSKSKRANSRRRQQPQSKPTRGAPMSRNFSGILKTGAGKPEDRKKSHAKSAGLSRALTGATDVSSSSKPRSIHAGPQASQKGLSVPFIPSHKILLVGEGDFSFTLSLFQHHKCRNLVATTFESSQSLLEKHPQTAEYLKTLTSSSQASGTSRHPAVASPKLVYNIDATVLCHPSRGGGSSLRRLGPFDRIVFNFPHVGGLTKDVNRQVRANQELCVKFLESASKKDLLAEGGRVVVTLFEGDPYELWGIRNLARHVGLAVVRSSRFEWEQYPGYKHARTLGNIKGKHGGEAKGAWRGEERRARMYIFGRPGEEDKSEQGNKRRKRRNSNGSTSSEVSFDDEFMQEELEEEPDSQGETIQGEQDREVDARDDESFEVFATDDDDS